MLTKIHVRFLSVILSFIITTTHAQPRNEGRYYSRDTELLGFSEVLTSTLWAIGLLGIGALILFNIPKNEKDQSGLLITVGCISTLIGLFCLAPLFAYLFVGLQLIIALAVVVGILITIWTSLTKKTEPVVNNNSKNIQKNESQKSVSSLIEDTQAKQVIINVVPAKPAEEKKRYKTYWEGNKTYSYDAQWRKVYYETYPDRSGGYSYYYDEKGIMRVISTDDYDEDYAAAFED